MLGVAGALHPSPWVQYSQCCWVLVLYGVDSAAVQVTVAAQVGVAALQAYCAANTVVHPHPVQS